MNMDVNQLSDLQSVVRSIEQVDKDEIAIELEIKSLISKKNDVDVRLKELYCSVPDFGPIKANSFNLTHMITSASELAMELSGKVRQLDLVKNRVQTCVSLLDDVINLKEYSEAAEDALRRENYEKAATVVSKSLTIGDDVLRISEQISSDVGARESVARLTQCRQQLVALTDQKVTTALSKNDHANVERFCKLYPLLGKRAEGLERLGVYLSSLLRSQGQSFIKLAELPSTNDDNTGCLDLLTQIFEFAAETLRDKQPYVEKHYGSGNYFQIASVLQNECDHLVSQVHHRFKTQHHFSELMPLVQLGFSHSTGQRWSTSSNPPASGTNFATSTSSSSSGAVPTGMTFDKVLSLEPIISDIVLLNTRTELYMRFVRRRITVDLNNATDLTDADREAKLNAAVLFFDNCQTSRLMQDLIGTYITLERYYLHEMIIKAVSTDELDDSTKTSRFADDVFFILKQCLSRSLSSGSVDGICAMLNHACSSLKDHLLTNTLVARIRAGFPSGWMQDAYSYMQSSVAAVTPGASSGTIGSGSTTVNSSSNMITGASTTAVTATTSGPASSGHIARQQFLIALNTVEACLTNLTTFSSLMGRNVEAMFSQPQDCASLRKIQACLNDLNQSISDQLKRLLDTGLDELTTSVIRGQAKSLLQPFQSVQYVLTENDLDICSTNDPWVETCISDSSNFISPFRSVLSSGNNDRFVSVLTTELVRRLELLIERKTYNRFGAVQLEKEVRRLFAYLASITYAALRDHFTRLLQICNLLNVEKVEEVSFYWNASTWRLSPKEVRRVLTLRSEFSAEDIRRLKL